MAQHDRQPVRSIWGLTIAAGLFLGGLLAPVAAGAQEKPASKYKNANEAYSAGAKFYNERNFAAAEEPFEAAFQLSDDPKQKLRIQKALMESYRLSKEIDKMTGAVEYVITHSDQAAEQSLVRRSFLSFVHQRGRTDDVVKRYEEQLKKEPENRTALFLLSEIYVELKKDPKRGAELVEKLAAVDKKSGKPVSVLQQAQLAQQYVAAKKFKEGAELFEKIAPDDEKLAAWHWKEAAAAWLKAGEKGKALDAAKKSLGAKPEGRSEQLAYFYHKGVADVLLDAGEAKLAVPQYELALTLTKIDGYLKECKEKLAKAKDLAGEKK